MFDNNNNDLADLVHVVDAYANEYYVNENEINSTFFEDSFVGTQEDLNNTL